MEDQCAWKGEKAILIYNYQHFRQSKHSLDSGGTLETRINIVVRDITVEAV